MLRGRRMSSTATASRWFRALWRLSRGGSRRIARVCRLSPTASHPTIWLRKLRTILMILTRSQRKSRPRPETYRAVSNHAASRQDRHRPRRIALRCRRRFHSLALPLKPHRRRNLLRFRRAERPLRTAKPRPPRPRPRGVRYPVIPIRRVPNQTNPRTRQTRRRSPRFRHSQARHRRRPRALPIPPLRQCQRSGLPHRQP